MQKLVQLVLDYLGLGLPRVRVRVRVLILLRVGWLVGGWGSGCRLSLLGIFGL